jgi:hypothetical protein
VLLLGGQRLRAHVLLSCLASKLQLESFAASTTGWCSWWGGCCRCRSACWQDLWLLLWLRLLCGATLGLHALLAAPVPLDAGISLLFLLLLQLSGSISRRRQLLGGRMGGGCGGC